VRGEKSTLQIARGASDKKSKLLWQGEGERTKSVMTISLGGKRAEGQCGRGRGITFPGLVCGQNCVTSTNIKVGCQRKKERKGDSI